MKALFLALVVVVSVGCGSTEQHRVASEPFTGIISADAFSFIVQEPSGIIPWVNEISLFSHSLV